MDARSEKLLVLVVALLSYSLTYGQNKNQKSQFVILPTGVVRLDTVLKRISNQTGFTFSYDARKVNRSLKLNLIQSQYLLEEILVKVTKEAGLTSSVIENHIILKPTKSSRPEELIVTSQSSSGAKKTSEQKVSKTVSKGDSLNFSEHKSKKLNSELPENESPVENDSTEKIKVPIIEKEKTSKTVSTENNSIDNYNKLTDARAISDKPKKTGDSITSNSISALKIKKEPKAESKTEKTKKNASSLLAMAGLTFDETLYLGPTVEIGIPALFATASYKTNFNVGMFSYGIGTSMKIQHDWRLNLFITTGSTSKSYDSLRFSRVDSSHVSNHRITKAKSNLVRVGLLVEKKMSANIVLQGGILYNSLATEYTINGEPTSPGSFGSNADKTIYAIMPPYTLSNSYTPSSDSNVKTWLGVQLSIFYVFNFSKRE